MEKKKILFIDRDGTIIKEPPEDFQVDSLEKLEFYPGVFRNLYFICKNLDYLLVMVSNQDGMGTGLFPAADFEKPHTKMMTALANEGIIFDAVKIDPSMPEDNSPNRKPGTGMLQEFLTGDYDLDNSYVIGDRLTDIQLAKNIGCKGILLSDIVSAADLKKENLGAFCALQTSSWDEIYTEVARPVRTANVKRITRETSVDIRLDLDGTGKGDVQTGLGFFDHMLDQIARHSGVDLIIHVKGDLEVDEHHTIEDTGLALGECFLQALGNKRGIERYGFALPMDESLVQVVIDFGGRPWLVWDAEFKREKVGDMPTEMFFHFFKSFSDASKSNINIKAEGSNEHHKIEGIFKALARAIKMAIKYDSFNNELPTTKGML